MNSANDGGSFAPRLLARNRVDLLAGGIIVALGLFGLFLIWPLAVGTSTRMGAGYWPRAVCFVLLLLGSLLVIKAYRGRSRRLDLSSFRSIGLLIAAILVFALSVEQIGLIATVVCTVGVAALASSESRLVEAVVLAVALAIFAALVFVKAIGLTIPLFP